MSNEQQATKNFFTLSGGLNTEINELNFPDGFTKDEANYELMVDGSRRRRKGLASESGAGSALDVTAWRTGENNQTYVWRNVGGDPNKKVVVYIKGDLLYYADADETVSNGWASGTGSVTSLTPFWTTGATQAKVEDASVSLSQGRGFLFVSGPYIKSFYVTYIASTGEYSATLINIRYRDFSDVTDGLHIALNPTGTIGVPHRYNLRNRGWKQDDMDTFFNEKAKHPAKNAIWWKGYKRVYAASVSESDGQRQ